jgi:mono/diheme cytochrome c family protein
LFNETLLETPVNQKEGWLQRAVLIFGALFAIALLLLGIGSYQSQRVDPYGREVLSLVGNPAQGNAIFQMNCAGCHGSLADGRVGPSLRDVSSRKSKLSLIHQVTSGQTPPMPQFQPSPQEMADLLTYLESL